MRGVIVLVLLGWALLSRALATDPSSPVGAAVVDKEPLHATRHRPSIPNKILLIRHGEKPGHNKEGLSEKGRRRAQCLRKVFGRRSPHNIGLIIAQSYNLSTGARKRPYATVVALAEDLRLPVITDCNRNDPDCVVNLVQQFAKYSRRDVLICWKHSFLLDLAKAFGSQARLEYPDKRFDIVWIVQHRKIISKKSEKCCGLDVTQPHDPDLAIEDEHLRNDTVRDMEDGADDDEEDDLESVKSSWLSMVDRDETQELSFDDIDESTISAFEA
ncbi:BQ5605_C003g02182 [Microbotryum silenes-dioicae]|uniref:BQ5605_C003g02182 protein n=1 Tax=Microbotryum silenes-dioicae TaxID=796604 RepID=A0A2X0M586_9BASI|nr:BQ5605_C003g02182 [Microbotryum silenes-dioicae]